MTKETKLNSTLRKHLLNIAKGFANDQKISNNHQYHEKICAAQRRYVEEHTTEDILKKIKKIESMYDSYLSEKENLKKILDKQGLNLGAGYNITVSANTEVEIRKKMDSYADVQWDVILSTVALKLELCNTFEEAKNLIEQVTGANVDSMITTIIPPNLQLTNNNN